MTLSNMHLDDLLSENNISVYDENHLTLIYKTLKNIVIEQGYKEPFMSNFIRDVYGVYDSEDLTYLLENYTKKMPAFTDLETGEPLISLFGCMTDEESYDMFINNIIKENKYNDHTIFQGVDELYPLDVFANFALLTEKMTKQEIITEYVGIIFDKEQQALATIEEKEIEEPYLPVKIIL